MWSSDFCTSVAKQVRLLFWNENPQNNIGQQSRQSAWNQQDQKEQAEPERIETKESAQPTTYTGYDSILATQLIVSHCITLYYPSQIAPQKSHVAMPLVDL